MKDTQDENADQRPDGPSPQQKIEAAEGKQDVGDEERSSKPEWQSQEVGGTEGSAEKPGILPVAAEEDEMSVYPLREPSEDARWAVRTVWIWIGFGIASLIFIATLLVLGAMYD